MNDYYSLLGVERQATTAEIAQAYRQVLIRERQEKGSEADLGLYSLAYRTLTVPAKRQEYDRLLDRIAGRYVIKNPETPTEAEKCYLAGLTCLEQKNFQDAVDYLSRAVQLEPEESHFCSQLGLALGMFSDKLAEAERYCKKAIELDPDNPDFFFNLGFLYQRHNLVDAAQTAFDQANEAIKKREARILGQGQPLITPWEGQGQSLMEELARIESLVQGLGAEAQEPKALATETETVPEKAPVTAEEAAGGEDLLQEITKIEAQITSVESEAEAVAADKEPAPPVQASTAVEEAAGWNFDDADLLKELDILEAQVRGVEELHNGEMEKEAQTAVSLAETGPLSEPAPAPSPTFSLPAEYRTTESFNLTDESSPPSAEATAEELTSLSGETSQPSPSTMSPEAKAGIEELTLPEVLREFGAEPQGKEAGTAAAPKEPLTSQAAPAVAEAQAGAEAGISTREVSQAEAAGDRAEALTTGFPSLPAQEKLRMLEELEREMMSELDRLKMEKQKIMEAVGG